MNCLLSVLFHFFPSWHYFRLTICCENKCHFDANSKYFSLMIICASKLFFVCVRIITSNCQLFSFRMIFADKSHVYEYRWKFLTQNACLSHANNTPMPLWFTKFPLLLICHHFCMIHPVHAVIFGPNNIHLVHRIQFQPSDRLLYRLTTELLWVVEVRSDLSKWYE